MLLASNHRSFLDPFAIGCCLPPADLLRRQAGALQVPADRLDPQLPGRVPDPPRRVRRGVDEDRPHAARARRRRRDLPGGHAPPHRLARRAQARRRAPGPRDRRAGRADRGARLGARAARARSSGRSRSSCAPGARSPSRAWIEPSKSLANEVTARIWPCVELQWEWLGGLPPLRKAAVVGAGSAGTAIAALLARAGLDVQLGCRDAGHAERIAADGENGDYLPGVGLPDNVSPTAISQIEFAGVDLVVMAVPSYALPAGRRLGGRPDRRPKRSARTFEGPRRAAGDAADALHRRPRQRARDRLPRRPGARGRVGRARRARRARLRPTPPCATSSARCSSKPASTSSGPTTWPAFSSRARPRTPRPWPPPRPRTDGMNAAGAAAARVFAEVHALARRTRRAHRDLPRAGRRGRPARHRAGRALAQPPRGRAARPGRARRSDPGAASRRPPRASPRSRCSSRRSTARASTAPRRARCAA